jgi:type IV pilus assembly protein PilO
MIALPDWAKQVLKLEISARSLSAVADMPVPLRWGLWALVVVAMALALWVLVLRSDLAELERLQDRQTQLRVDYRDRLAQTLRLESLRQQRAQAEQDAKALEQHLPSRAQMEELLSDINQTGKRRRLEFDLFRPGQIALKAQYAELPVALRVTGRYADLGAFVADLAHFSRIVTLERITLGVAQKAQRAGAGSADKALLTLDAQLKAYRALEPDEQAQVQAQLKQLQAQAAKKRARP